MPEDTQSSVSEWVGGGITGIETVRKPLLGQADFVWTLTAGMPRAAEYHYRHS